MNRIIFMSVDIRRPMNKMKRLMQMFWPFLLPGVFKTFLTRPYVIVRQQAEVRFFSKVTTTNSFPSSFCSQAQNQICKSLSPPFDALFNGLQPLCEMCKHMCQHWDQVFSLFRAGATQHRKGSATPPAQGNVYCSCDVQLGKARLHKRPDVGLAG